MQSPTTTIPAEKSAVSPNGTPQNQPQQAPSAINKLVEANTSLVIWLIFLAIGGGLLALYYARIGYLPDIEWKSVLIYLFIGSIVGGVIGLLLTISLYLPGVIWSETLVYDPSLNFSYTAPVGEQGKEAVTELCLKSIFGYLGLPFLVVLLLSHLVLALGKWYWAFAAVFLGLTFLVMRILLKYKVANNSKVSNGQPKPGPLWRYVWKSVKSDLLLVKRKLKLEHPANVVTTTDLHVFKLSSAFTLSVLLNQVSMYLIYRLSGRPAEFFPSRAEFGIFIILTLLCTAGVWIAGHVVAVRHRDHPRQAVLAALIVAGLLLFTADHFSSLSTRLMNHYGIGDYQRVNLLLTPHGGDIAKRLEVSTCVDLVLCNVEILSKVGDHYFLRVGDTAYLTLPKADVVAIRPLN